MSNVGVQIVPVKSKAQGRLMGMVAHDPKAAKRLGIPQSVGEEFVEGGIPKGLPNKARAKGPRKGARKSKS